MNNSEDDRSHDFEMPDDMILPASIDWRHKGAVTHVKNQRDCRSNWAFATTGAIEGQYFLKTGHLLSLSEQNLIDCSPSNFGCNGGNTIKAFQDIISSGKGIKTEKQYPYAAINGFCRNSSNIWGVRVHDFVRIPAHDERKLQYAIATKGPIAAAMDASNRSFLQYGGGIYYEHNCNSSHPTHPVLIVGYGTDEHQLDYYIVKNSWGTGWGENGYFRIIRNHRNHCGIATQASYPIV